ncbi:hypothetical protein [Amycolatopsis sp. cmx-4-68]|uniref:hypothetical protein n=1 Tax=Amycolatopsis sp. cmx-4-68 TaxID=2790938 RepID=UPI00397CD2B0
MHEPHGVVDLGARLGRKPDNEVALDVDPTLGEPAHHRARHVRGDALVDPLEHPGGFAVHDDPTYANPQSQTWQAEVIQTVHDWLTTG